MSIRTFARPLLLAALAGSAALPLACKSTEGHDRAATTADQVVAVGAAAGQAQLQLDQTLNDLAQVAAKAAQDPKPPFDAFVKSLGKFQDDLAFLTKQRGALAAKAQTWFDEYKLKNDAIQDPDLKQAGEKRLCEFQARVGEVSKQVDELMTGAGALDGRLKDLRTFLGNDLTPKGIETVAGRIADTVKEGRKVAAGLGKASKASEEVAKTLRAAQQPAEAK
jgi:hypothetical protein